MADEYSKGYRVQTIQETDSGVNPNTVRTVQVTVVPLAAPNAPPVPMGMPGSAGPIVFTYQGEEAEWATNFFTVGNEYDNIWAERVAA